MIRKFIIAAFALLGAMPAFSNTTTTQMPKVQAHPALHLMSNSEFANFLSRLDADIVHSQSELKKIDVKSPSLGTQDREEQNRTYNRCLQSLDNVREEVQKLSQGQTLKLDLFLLIDLNELARNLDALDQGFMNPAAAGGKSQAIKSLGYAREVLNIEVALTSDISTFENHFLAFAGVIDATLYQADREDPQPDPQK